MASQTLPTIPGTPAAMEQNFNLPDMGTGGGSGPLAGQNVSRAGSREPSRNRGSAEVVRKPVGGSANGSRGVSPNVNGRYEGGYH